MPSRIPEIGDFVEVRGRPWPVEGIDDKGEGLSALQLSCISDDAQGEALGVAWDAENRRPSSVLRSWRATVRA
jgi:hypothetical protein